jgi:tellurite resistance protein
MGFWKVMGGVAAGIVTVVALPVAGPIGAISLAGAAVAGTIGGAAGAVASKKESEKEQIKVSRAYREGQMAGRKESEMNLKELTKAFEDVSSRLSEHKEYFDLLTAMFAVGISVANCDGSIDPKEERDIDEFIAGIVHSELPTYIIDTITTLRQNPPSFNSAMQYVKHVNKDSWDLFSEIIDLVSRSDDIVRPEEIAYKSAWREFMAA